MVKVSKEYFVELNQEETLRFVDSKETLLNSQIQTLTQKIAEIKAHLIFVKASITELLILT